MGRVTQPCMLDLDAIYSVDLHYGCIVFCGQGVMWLPWQPAERKLQIISLKKCTETYTKWLDKVQGYRGRHQHLIAMLRKAHLYTLMQHWRKSESEDHVQHAVVVIMLPTCDIHVIAGVAVSEDDITTCSKSSFRFQRHEARKSAKVCSSVFFTLTCAQSIGYKLPWFTIMTYVNVHISLRAWSHNTAGSTKVQ